MNGTNDTNAVVTGSGTPSDPYIYNYHENAQSYGTPWMFYLIVAIILGSVATGGFLLGFYFGNRRKKSN